MLGVLYTLLAIYSWLILRRYYAWHQLPDQHAPEDFVPATRLTVVIPVRNEAANIPLLLHDLATQLYPHNLVEILVVDDHSEDATPDLVEQMIKTFPFALTCVRLKNYVNHSGKKAAVQVGVTQAAGELLVFTDGDCRVGPEWLRQYAYTYQMRQPYFISGPVCFQHTPTLFERMQQVEFASLIGIGAASLQLGKPNMCNGANLAYTKTVFEKTGGFAGNEDIASGDDEFLLHKVHKSYPGKAVFLKSSKAIVYTCAANTLKAFMLQRIRWASKWKAYQSIQVQAMAVIVFLVNLALVLSVVWLLLGKGAAVWVVAGFCVKFAVDFLFLNSILHFLGRRRYIWYMLPLQFCYIPYVLGAGIGGLVGKYNWKGRKIRTP